MRLVCPPIGGSGNQVYTTCISDEIKNTHSESTIMGDWQDWTLYVQPPGLTETDVFWLIVEVPLYVE